MSEIDEAVAYVTLHRVRDQIGEAFHTGLRKASEHPTAAKAWQAIADMPRQDWHAVLEFALDGLGINHALARSPKTPVGGAAERLADRLYEIGMRLDWWPAYRAECWRDLDDIARKEFLGIAIGLVIAAQVVEPPREVA